MTEQAFYNKVINGTAMKRLISRLIDHFGMGYTSHILDQLKALGFHQATATSISLGIDDLLTISSKQWLVQDAEQQSSLLEQHQLYGNVHAVEKLRQSIEIWYAASEYLRQEMNPNFRMTDPSNPVYLMSFSGARGNASQIHQLVGMRGLMSDPQGQMIDLPIQSNLREGLSLTEYIISCYGARKGVVDTAIRTADAGYLTRRLVEVVQHIVVRRRDCGTIQGISVSPKNGMTEPIFVQTLIGRVLADDIYIGLRCIATRNQDIGIGLINQFITFRTQPIYIRTPFTCRSTSWICQLCYGRSPTHGDLVELGEAVGIIAGQSIGEPGTQLTLRTFHTGGVFTGGTAQHVRTPFHGKIKFNEDLLHPTRTRHGHPAFLCSTDFYVTIESRDMIHNVSIPAKSLILVQNDQYVESEQVIAEIRTGMSTFPFKEKVEKHIYSESGGELHWSTDVYHTPKHTYSNVHLLPKTSHLWVLAGSPCRSGRVSFSVHKDQDQMNVDSFSVEERFISIPDLSKTNNQVRCKVLDTSSKGEFLEHSRTDQIISNSHSNFIYPSIQQEDFDFLAKKRRNRFFIPFKYDKESEKELISCFSISMEIPINGIFHRNSILAYFDDPRYKISSSGIIQYGIIEMESIIKKEDLFLIEDQAIKEIPEYQTLIEDQGIKEFAEYQTLIEYQKYQMLIEYQKTQELSLEYQTFLEDQETQELSPEYQMPIEDQETQEFSPEYQMPIEDQGVQEFSPEYQMLIEDQGTQELRSEYQRKVDPFFFIPEEVHILPRSSSIKVQNNSIIGVNTWLTLNKRSRVGGLVQVEKTKKYIELKIFYGDIHFPREIDKIFRHSDILIPRETGKKNSKKSKKWKDWIYIQGITLIKKKYFVSVRPVIPYEIPDQIDLGMLFSQDLLQEKDNLQLRVVNYFLYGDSKSIRIICLKSIQLVRTCLVLNWDQDQNSSIEEEVHASFVEIKTSYLIRNFIKMELLKPTISYIGKRYERASSGFIPENRLARTNINPFYFNTKIQSFSQRHGTMGTLLNRNKDYQSLIILSSSNCSQMDRFKKNTVKINRNPLFIFGPLGAIVPKITNLSLFYELVTHNEIFLKKYFLPAYFDNWFDFFDNLKEVFLLLNIFSIDIENVQFDPFLIVRPSLLEQTVKVLIQIYNRCRIVPLELAEYCLIDENRRIYNPDLPIGFFLNPFDWNWYPNFHENSWEDTSTTISLGQFICENVCLFQDEPYVKKSGQIVILNLDSLVIRSAKPYLLTSGATVHGHYGEIFYKGGVLVTFLYEKSRSSDITQGLPKVEQIFEVRSIALISINLKRRVETWNQSIPRILGVPWIFFIGAELTIAQSRISLVNKIQKVYRSQGVHIHNRHIEMIVRQVTSKVLVSEDGMSNVFLPRELIGLLRAERAGRALDESIFYRAILLGLTRASLNTQSFISEASFQETARVLAKAALRGRIDWLKGLKENVVLGRILPIGTALKKCVHPSRHQKSFALEKKTETLFELEMRDMMLHHKELLCSDMTNNLYETNSDETL